MTPLHEPLKSTTDSVINQNMTDPLHSWETLEGFLNKLYELNGITGDAEPIYLDLREIPEDQWQDMGTVTLPANFAQYIDTHDTLTFEEIEVIEVALEKFYKTPEDRWFITAAEETYSVNFDAEGKAIRKVVKKPRFLLQKKTIT